MSSSPLKEFLSCLAGLHDKPERVGELLSGVELTSADLRDFIFFRDHCYTRNLIYQDPHWEVLALCWQRGHVTPIHDHSGSRGWAYIVQGSLLETLYRVSSGEQGEDFSLTRLSRTSLPAQKVSYIDDALGCHSLANIAADRSVSLHVYSPVIKSCRYYSLSPRESKMRTLAYFSVAGAILPPVTVSP